MGLNVTTEQGWPKLQLGSRMRLFEGSSVARDSLVSVHPFPSHVPKTKKVLYFKKNKKDFSAVLHCTTYIQLDFFLTHRYV